ncbi:MAG: addiction module protein [Planctomycetaceae bacterium]
MMQSTEQLYHDALALSESERAALAARLIQSLERADKSDVLPAWSDEIHRRIQELDDGSVQPVPWSEARRMIVADDDASC